MIYLQRENNDKVGVKEYAAILIFAMGLKVTDTTPINFYKISKNAGWMIPLISVPIALVSLYCLLKLLEKYKDKNYIEIIYKLTGKRIGLLLGAVIFFNKFSLTVVNTRSYVDIISTLYFPRTPMIVLATIFVGSSFIMAWLGIEAIGRTAWMVFPWIFFTMILYIVLTANLYEVGFLFPIAGSGISKTIKGGITSSGIFSELITFAVIFPQIKSFKDFKNASYFSIVYNTVIITFFCAIYVMVLDYPSVIYSNYPFHTVARLIYGGRFISNTESFFMIFWIIASVVRFGIYAYTNTLVLSYTLRLKDAKPLFATVAALTLALSLLPDNSYQMAANLRKSIFAYSVVPMYIIPVLLLLMSKWRGGNAS